MTKKIEVCWNVFRSCALPPDTPTSQVDELRGGFYAGAYSLFRTMDLMIQQGGDVNAIKQELKDEMEEFMTVIADRALSGKQH